MVLCGMCDELVSNRQFISAARCQTGSGSHGTHRTHDMEASVLYENVVLEWSTENMGVKIGS